MSERGLYELVLEQVAAGASLPATRAPRASAAVVLWRRDESGEIEVWWMRRAETLAFMGGWHAFPGGGLAKDDREIPVAGEPSDITGAPADGGMPPAVVGDLELGEVVPPGLVGCALRELFEETGLLIADSDDGGEALNAKLTEGERFAAALAALDLELDARQLVYGGRWLTPPLGPLRFDNRFFLLEWPAGATDSRVPPRRRLRTSSGFGRRRPSACGIAAR